MGSALSVKNYESPADRRLAGGFLADTTYACQQCLVTIASRFAPPMRGLKLIMTGLSTSSHVRVGQVVENHRAGSAEQLALAVNRMSSMVRWCLTGISLLGRQSLSSLSAARNRGINSGNSIFQPKVFGHFARPVVSLQNRLGDIGWATTPSMFRNNRQEFPWQMAARPLSLSPISGAALPLDPVGESSRMTEDRANRKGRGADVENISTFVNTKEKSNVVNIAPE